MTKDTNKDLLELNWLDADDSTYMSGSDLAQAPSSGRRKNHGIVVLERIHFKQKKIINEIDQGS